MATERAEAGDWQALLPGLLAEAGLGADPAAEITPLGGGVSSDIVRVRLASGRDICAKRALGRLKVRADWQAPVERNHYEAEWLRRAGGIVPGIAPAVLAEDRERGTVLIEYLPPGQYAGWKAELMAGRLDIRVAPALGAALGAIHAATWDAEAVAAAFPTDALFDALRLDPYLRTLAERVPELAAPILSVLEVTAGTRLALVHGDVSPKNILVARADGHPVLLDAECAWYGDPAFDAAFLVNHLLLKALHLPALRDGLLVAASGFEAAWSQRLPTMERAGASARAAALVGCLMLARVDGKSPVEYLDSGEQEQVRALAKPLILAHAGSLPELVARVADGLAAQG